MILEEGGHAKGWCDGVGCGRRGELDESKGDVKTYTKLVLTNR